MFSIMLGYDSDVYVDAYSSFQYRSGSKLISKEIFEDPQLFNKDVDTDTLSLLKSKEEDLKDILKRLCNTRTKQQLQYDLLALVFRDPSLSNKVLLELTEEFNLIKKGLLLAVCIKGNIDLLETLAKKHPVEFNEFIAGNKYQGFCYAAKYNHTRVVKCILSRTSLPLRAKMILSNNSAAFLSACEHGNMPMVEILIAEVSEGSLAYLGHLFMLHF